MRPDRSVGLAGSAVAAACCAALALACHRGEPPMPNVDAAVAPLPPPGAARGERARMPANVAGSPPASGGAGATGAAGAAGAPGAPGDSGAPSAPGAPVTPDAGAPLDAGPDPGTLPQTHDEPQASGAAFEARAAALWTAIVTDDPVKGMPFFFPLSAYEQVKDVGNPASDWRHRLVANYRRDIHALHKRLGEHASDAKLVKVDVPQARAKWVDPGEEYNKLGYYRVYGTHIVYETGSGKERTFDVSSLISWRGQWYVVHLTGFK